MKNLKTRISESFIDEALKISDDSGWDDVGLSSLADAAGYKGDGQYRAFDDGKNDTMYEFVIHKKAWPVRGDKPAKPGAFIMNDEGLLLTIESTSITTKDMDKLIDKLISTGKPDAFYAAGFKDYVDSK